MYCVWTAGSANRRGGRGIDGDFRLTFDIRIWTGNRKHNSSAWASCEG